MVCLGEKDWLKKCTIKKFSSKNFWYIFPSKTISPIGICPKLLCPKETLLLWNLYPRNSPLFDSNLNRLTIVIVKFTHKIKACQKSMYNLKQSEHKWQMCINSPKKVKINDAVFSFHQNRWHTWIFAFCPLLEAMEVIVEWVLFPDYHQTCLVASHALVLPVIIGLYQTLVVKSVIMLICFSVQAKCALLLLKVQPSISTNKN